MHWYTQCHNWGRRHSTNYRQWFRIHVKSELNSSASALLSDTAGWLEAGAICNKLSLRTILKSVCGFTNISQQRTGLMYNTDEVADI